MLFSRSILVALCFVCGAFWSFAQSPLGAPAPKADGVYLPLKKCWEYAVENVGRSAVSAYNGTIYVAENDGRVRSLNARTGEVNWVTELGGRVTALHTIAKLGIVAVTAAPPAGRPFVRLLSPDSGLVRYSVPVSVGDEIFLLSSGTKVLIVDSVSVATLLDANTGQTVWQYKLPGRITAPPAGSDQFVVLATENKLLSIMSWATGRITSTIPVKRNIKALIVRENDMIVAGDDRGNVTNYRDVTGAVWWQFKSGARVGTILETEEGLIVGSFDNFLYLLSKYSGDVRWKRRLEGRIVSPPAVFNGYLISAASTENNAQVIELESGKSVDQLIFGEGRVMLSSPSVSDGSVTIFTLVDGLAAYSPNGCSSN